MYILGIFIHIIIDCWIFTRKHTLIFSSEQKRKWKQSVTRIIYYSSCQQIVVVKTMIYSSFHMTQDVAIAILPRIGRMSVSRHFFILPRIRRIGRMSPVVTCAIRQKNKINPLERMEGVALAAMLPLWSYKSELLTPKPEAYHHLPCRRSPSSPRR